MIRSRTLVLGLLLFAVAAFMHANAHAQSVSFPAAYQCSVESYGGGAWSQLSASCVDAAQSVAATYNIISPVQVPSVSCSGSYPSTTCTANDHGTLRGMPVRFATSPSCPSSSGATLSGSICACPSGDTLGSDGASCVAPPVCAGLAGQSAGNWSWTGNSTSYICDDTAPGVPVGTSCVVKASGSIGITVPGQPEQWSGNAVYTGATGTNCNGDGSGSGTSTAPAGAASAATSSTPPPAGQAAPTPCSAGMLPSTFNGVTTCVAAGAVGAGTVSTVPAASTTTTNPDGSSTGVQTSASTSCSGDTCTTTTTATTTITPASGAASSTTSSTTKTQGVAAACASGDASVAQCAAAGLSGGSGGSSSSFSGSCAGGFQAQSDDAVINAMAREQYSRNCTFFGDDTDPSSVANQALSGADGKNTDAMKSAAAAAPVSIGSFNESGYGFGSACPADPVILIPWGSGSTLTIPFDKLCGPLGILALAVEALTLLGCFAWVVGGKK